MKHQFDYNALYKLPFSFRLSEVLPINKISGHCSHVAILHKITTGYTTSRSKRLYNYMKDV